MTTASARSAIRSRARPAKAAPRPAQRGVAQRSVSRSARSSGRLVTLRTNGQITLPAEVRERVGARTGDVFLAEVEDDVVVLRPKKLIDSSQAWF